MILLFLQGLFGNFEGLTGITFSIFHLSSTASGDEHQDQDDLRSYIFPQLPSSPHSSSQQTGDPISASEVSNSLPSTQLPH